MKNILVAIDFSPIGKALIKAAADQAKCTNAKVWVIHVAAPDPDFIGYSVGPTYVREERAYTLKEEHKKLNEVKIQLKAEGVNAECILVQGPTVQTLIEEIEKLKAELLIIGKKGHSVLYKAFVGSVFNQAIKEVEIPVLAIPGEE